MLQVVICRISFSLKGLTVFQRKVRFMISGLGRFVPEHALVNFLILMKTFAKRLRSADINPL